MWLYMKLSSKVENFLDYQQFLPMQGWRKTSWSSFPAKAWIPYW